MTDPFELINPATDKSILDQNVNNDPFSVLSTKEEEDKDDPFSLINPQTSAKTAPRAATAAPHGRSIGKPGSTPTPRKTGLEIAQTSQEKEDESRFLNSVQYSWDATKANFLSLFGYDKEAEEILASSNTENADRGDIGGFMGSAIYNIIPTVAASAAAMFAAPLTAAVVGTAATAYFVMQSMGQAQGEIYRKEQETGEDVPLTTEIGVTLGHGITTAVVERLGISSMTKAARLLNARQLVSVGKHFSNREFAKASKIIAKSFPKAFHQAGMAEGAEEALENTIHNAMSMLYDEQRELRDGLLMSIAQGYVAGGLGGGAMSQARSFSGRELTRAQAQIDEFINQQSAIISKEISTYNTDFIQPTEYGSQIISSQLKPTGFREMEGISPVVFHGSTNKFTRFDRGKLGSNTGAKSAKEGFFFSSKPLTAASYASNASAKMKDAEARLAKVEARITEIGNKPSSQINTILWEALVSKDTPEWAQSEQVQKELSQLSDEWQDILWELDYLTSINAGVLPAHTESLDIAPEGQLKAYHLRMQNPFVVDFETDERHSYTSIIREAKKAGHDSVIIKNTVDPATSDVDEVTDLHIVFNESQIQEANVSEGSIVSYISMNPGKTSLEWNLENLETEVIEGTPQTPYRLGVPLVQFSQTEQTLEGRKAVAELLESEQGDQIILGDESTSNEVRKSRLSGLKAIAAKLTRPFMVLGEAIDVRTAFGNKETGAAIENSASTRVAYIQEGENVIRQVRDSLGKYNDDQNRMMVSLLANDAALAKALEEGSLDQALTEQLKAKYDFEYQNSAEIQALLKAANILKGYMDAKLAELQQAGILHDGFYQNIATSLENQILRMKEQGKSKREIQEAEKLLEKVKRDYSFVHIPYNLLFAEGMLKDGNTISKLKYLTRKHRTTLTLEDLFMPVMDEDGNVVHEGLQDPTVLNYANIISSYSSRIGKDMALASIMEAGRADGYIRDKEEGVDYDAGFVPAPSLAKAVLKGKQIDKKLAAWINSNTFQQTHPNAFLKTLNFAKMVSFLNPLFLGMYDTIQGFYGGSINYKTLFRGNFKKAWESMWNNDAEMLEALKYGLESNIYSDSFAQNVSKAINISLGDGTLTGRSKTFALNYLKGNIDLKNAPLKVPVEMGKNLYHASFDLAWFLDGLVRRASYYTLRDKGLSVREAAEEAALIHGKYASVPTKTRRIANIPLYTPTFKIVMGKYFVRMTKDIVNGTRDFEDKNQRALETLFRLFLLMIGQTALMSGLGFKVEEFGRRYTRQVTDKTGKPQQINVTWSAPHNMFLKYVFRARNAVRYEGGSKLANFLKANRWELNPFWRIGYDVFVNNKDPQNGKPVYNNADKLAVRAIDQVKAVTRMGLPLVRGATFVFGPEADRIRRKDIRKVGEKYMTERELRLLGVLTSVPMNFLYVSDPESMKTIRAINTIGERLQYGGYDEYEPDVYEALNDPDRNAYLDLLSKRAEIRVTNDLERIDKLVKRLDRQLASEKKNLNQ